ncbi:DUF167 domain-containing protein [Pleurocapsa sp. PCC 7319]|uniref:DUF167 domain-containing protein n=1 Tax=Pleurocapsa sp. PCC 7319 TaxID=118161 RepID=UPI00034949CF|nr:DUF167 domain-containing protein [Pleurocapsa sp. PCC 7319]
MKIKIRVKPNSKQQKVEELEDGSLVIRLKSLPIKGKANQELIKLLAERYQVNKFQIIIKSGLSSSNKLIEIN